MNKTDIVFYLTFLGAGWQLVSSQIQKLVSGNVFSWLSIAFMLIGLFAYMFYEKINGTTPSPQPPQA